MATATAAPKPTSHPFTCVTCAIAFRSSELQRGHMRSDWHRYNLKRRVASLPPLSSEVFAEKVLTAQASSKAAADKAAFEKSCQQCEKTYYSENAFKNHLGSQKHRMRVASLQTGCKVADDASSVISSTVSLGEPVAPESVDDPVVAEEFRGVIRGMKGTSLEEGASPVPRRPSRPHQSAQDSLRSTGGVRTPSVADTEDTVVSTGMPIQRCPFCNYDSSDLDTNITHMTRQHGLFVPEQAYLEDLEGLVEYLQAKVTQNCECIFCHKLKNTVSGVQTHMRDKGHCMIAFNTEEEMLEVGQFYDFRSTYSDGEDWVSEDTSDEDEDGDERRGAKLGAACKADASSEDEEWESEDEDREESSDMDRESSRSIKRTQRNPSAVAYEVDGELYLPSGRTAGHRSLARYFRQNLAKYPSPEERIDQQQKLLDSRAHNAEDGVEGKQGRGSDRRTRQLISRANGGLGMVGFSDEAKRATLKTGQKQERKAEMAQRQYQWGVQRRANNQTHFRDDNFGIR